MSSNHLCIHENTLDRVYVLINIHIAIRFGQSRGCFTPKSLLNNDYPTLPSSPFINNLL
jgi:hypothetical protein